MAKKLTGICLALSILISLSLTGMAYTLPAAEAVTVIQENGIYTVEVSNSVYANAYVAVTAVANGNTIPESMTDESIAYFSEKTADANGRATFTFEPKEGFDNKKGLYVAVSTDRGVDTVIAKAEYIVKSINSPHGEVTPAQDIIYEGDTVSFQIKADYGYIATGVSVTGGELSDSNEGGFIITNITNNLDITVNYSVAAAETGEVTVFNSPIAPAEFKAQFGEDITIDAMSAKYAAVIFSKVSSPLYECGVVYSKSNTDPVVNGDGCIVKASENIGSVGEYGIYLYSDSADEDTYYVKPYVKSGDEYTYGNVATFNLKEVE